MAEIALYRDVLRALSAVPEGQSAWPGFLEHVFYAHRAYFEGLVATYGQEPFDPGGIPGTLDRQAVALVRALAPAPSYGMEAEASRLLDRVSPLLPGTRPNLYLAVLFFIAPAATLSVLGRPAIALGLERFTPTPPAGGPKFWYHPSEAAEMVPHEAAHVARMQVLKLPPSPRHLTLLDMMMLEGTALTFTDQLLGRQTLATFMPSDQLAWHEAHQGQVWQAVQPELGRTGMDVFTQYFGANAPVSGYFAGYGLCREYLRRFGQHCMRELVAMPSLEILRRLAGGGGQP